MPAWLLPKALTPRRAGPLKDFLPGVKAVLCMWDWALEELPSLWVTSRGRYGREFGQRLDQLHQCSAVVARHLRDRVAGRKESRDFIDHGFFTFDVNV